jgi:hypothetical protein
MFEVIDCAELISAPIGYRWAVYLKGKRIKTIGKKGFFATREEAQQAIANATKYGTQNV